LQFPIILANKPSQTHPKKKKCRGEMNYLPASSFHSTHMRLRLIQFLMRSTQVRNLIIFFFTQSATKYFSKTKKQIFIQFYFVFLKKKKKKRNSKSRRMSNTPHYHSSLIDSTPLCPGPISLLVLLFLMVSITDLHTHVYIILGIRLMFLKLD
jgi:hypothetical protein